MGNECIRLIFHIKWRLNCIFNMRVIILFFLSFCPLFVFSQYSITGNLTNKEMPVKSIKSIEVVDKIDASVDSSKAGVIKISTIVKDGWVGSLGHYFQYKQKLGYSDELSLFWAKKL